jgi:hypothetical protein
VDELVAPTATAAGVTFARTDLPGVYTVTGIPDPDATAPPSAGPDASPTTAPASSPGASPTFRPADPDAPRRFAVAMLDVDESRIAPGDPDALVDLGQPAAAPGTGGTPAERPNARDELWIPIVLVALLVLTIEWLVYERDTLARLRRSLSARFRRASATGPGRGA